MVAPAAPAAAAAMSPMVQSALISVGGSLLGGMMGGKSDDSSKRWTNHWNRVQFEESQRQFNTMREDSKRAIQDRVADAKAAGVHPLYALGASASYSPTTFIPGQPAGGSGSHIGAAIAQGAGAVADLVSQGGRKPTPQELAQLRLLEGQLRATDASAERDLAEAALARSTAARQEQAANFTQGPQALVPGAFTTPLGAFGTGTDTPAEDWENKYGEIAGEIAGLLALGNDARVNLNRHFQPYTDSFWEAVRSLKPETGSGGRKHSRFYGR